MSNSTRRAVIGPWQSAGYVSGKCTVHHRPWEHPRFLGSLVGPLKSASDPRYGRLCRRRRHRRPLKGCTSGRPAPRCTAPAAAAAAACVVRSAPLEFADKYLGRTHRPWSVGIQWPDNVTMCPVPENPCQILLGRKIRLYVKETPGYF